MNAPVLTIQSAVACGHVGNSGAEFALRRLGFPTVRLDTVQFSNHPAHGGFRGGPVATAVLADLLDGLTERGMLARCGAVLSGYLGTGGNAAVVETAVTRLRAAREGAGTGVDTVFCCDPVLGDHPRGLYVRPDIPEVMRRLVALSDIAIPNRFELGFLTGRPVETVAEVAAAARALAATGPALVVVTGVQAAGDLGALAVTSERAWLSVAPYVDAPASGAGDVFAAVFLARWLEKRDAARALSLAVSSIHAVIAATAAAGGDELALIAAQDMLPAPSPIWPVQPVD
ncbi:pyridoxine kinase [Constrictibacter sp. MBR-5]|jgi:pyridoxine kinase|uniref:pyridoxal kinase n=1 Tax=Constrictibacter sp. MBR-5 TaxID=3156467 RepID=UPI0033996454